MPKGIRLYYTLSVFLTLKYYSILKWFTFLVGILFLSLNLFAQENNFSAQNVRTRSFQIQGQQIKLDTLSIVPNSILSSADSSTYSVDYANATLTWKSIPNYDSLRISYRVFPFSFAQTYRHKDYDLNYDTNFAMRPFTYSATDVKNQGAFVDFGNIDYSGAFGRALSFGNNQDVVLNSQFNLQLEGDLGDSIKIRGAITDNTIPFQPEGNTQQIQEFDRVTIELERKNTKVTAGDFDMRRPNGYFMNFYKRVQGARIVTKQNKKKKQNRLEAIGSFAKGKWVRNQLTALEGNQGPYKLTGANGENFFIVLAGTERVYIDGIQLERGENKDYIIDYNTAEVTFMPRKLITKDLRIFVEFEFADRNYLNSMLFLSDELTINKKLSLRLSAYSNQDAKNQPILADIDSSQRNFLRGVGNNIDEALFPAVRFDDTFSNEKILYRRTDSTIGGTVFPNVYVFSTNPILAKYRLAFTLVGPNNGNYIQGISSANGRVYEWVAPLNGIPQGDYEPVVQLVTPKKQQMVVAGMDYQIDSNKALRLETAISNYDPNTFSEIGNKENLGVAQKVIYNESRRFGKRWKLSSEVNYEFVQQNFRRIERFRNVEFVRDWNIAQEEEQRNEHLGKASVVLSQENGLGLGYTFGTFQRGSTFQGYQHIPLLFYKKKDIRFRATANTISQKSTLANTTFFRPIVEVEKTFSKLKNLTIGSKYLQEKNTYRNPVNDTLLPNAFAFNEFRVYARNNPSSKKQFDLNYMYRNDLLKKNDELTRANYSHNIQLNGQLLTIKNQQIRITATYRQLTIEDSVLSAQQADESLLGRVNYNFKFLKGLLGGNILYEFGSGQEQRREFTYVEVPAGQGVYVWRDYNQDNLRQLNEFEIAQFPDERRFIKIFTPTNQYVKAKYSRYSQSVAFNPRSIWNQSNLKGLKKLASYLFLQSSIQLQNRFLGKEGIAQYNPFIFGANDSLLLQNNASFINSVFINRFSNQWGIDYIQSNTNGRTLLNYGIDTRKNFEHLVRARINFGKKTTLTTEGKSGYRSFASQFLTNRNFFIRQEYIEPKLSVILLKNQLRISTSYKYDTRLNTENELNESANSQSAQFTLKYNIPSSGIINSQFTYNNIQYSGDANSSVGYAMLDGLQNGKNYLWNLSFDKRISKSVEMSLQYEGRKAGDAPVVHTGRASVRAIF